MVEGKNQWKAWLYLSPAIIILLIFTVWPIINTLRMAFLEEYNGLTALVPGMKFEVGFGNFEKVLFDPGSPFFKSLLNTVLLCVLTVPISTFLALLIAVCLNSIKWFSRLLQTIFFLPYVTNTIAIGMVFAVMFNVVGVGTANEQIGIINTFLDLFGIKRIDWIGITSEPWANYFVMVVYIVWNALPFKILILLGGLQSVNKQYYEAAKIDGTSRARTFWRITVPMLSPMIAYVVITGFIGGFKEYTSVVGIFGESMGPTNDPGRLNTIVGMIYDALADTSYGEASASALLLFILIFAVTLVNLYVSKKKVHY